MRRAPQDPAHIADFGHLLEGYQLFQEKVHPLLIPGGVMYAQNLVHQLRLAVEERRTWSGIGSLRAALD